MRPDAWWPYTRRLRPDATDVRVVPRALRPPPPSPSAPVGPWVAAASQAARSRR